MGPLRSLTLVEFCNMNERAEGVRVAHPLYQAGGDGSHPISALQLRFVPVGVRTAKALNRLWHSRLPRIGDPDSIFKAGACFAAEFAGVYYAAAIWSRPVARLLPLDGSWLELRRLAVAPDAPRNTASRMLGWMARHFRANRPEVVRLLSYQDTAVHTGGIYRAAGWSPVEVPGSNTDWNMPGRPRPAVQSDAPKVRWEKALRVG